MTMQEELDYEIVNEQQLPEAGAVVNLDISWHGKVMRYTLRAFDDAEMLEKLVQLEMKLPDMGMEIVSMKGKPRPEGGAKPKKSVPVKEAPEAGTVDETVIDVTSIWIHQGKKNKMAFVKGTPGYEEEGVVAFDDAFKLTGYNLQEQVAGQRYAAEDFGFVRAVIRFVDGKPRVWRFLTEREKIPF